MMSSCNTVIDPRAEEADARVRFDRLTALLFTAAVACLVLATLHGQSQRGITAAVAIGMLITGVSACRFAVVAWRPGNARRMGAALLFACVILLPSSAAGATPLQSLLVSIAVLTIVVSAFACIEAFSRSPSGLLSKDAFTLIVTLGAAGALAARLALHILGRSGSIQPWYSLAPAGLQGGQPFQLFFAFAMLLAFPMAAGAAMDRRGWSRVLHAAAASCIAIGVVLSFSRAAWIAFAIELLVLIRFHARRRTLIVAMGLVCLAAILAVPGAASRAATLAHATRGTGIQRLAQWAGAMSLIAEHPVLGIGPGAFGSEFRLDRPYGSVTRYLCPHNLYLHIAVECGLPALFLFLTAVVLGMRFVRGPRGGTGPGGSPVDAGAFRHAALASLVGLFVFGFFDL